MDSISDQDRELIITAFVGDHPVLASSHSHRDDSARLIRSTLRNLSETAKSYDMDSLEFILELGGASPTTIKDVIQDLDYIKGNDLSIIVEDFKQRRTSLDSTVSNIINLHQQNRAQNSRSLTGISSTADKDKDKNKDKDKDKDKEKEKEAEKEKEKEKKKEKEKEAEKKKERRNRFVLACFCKCASR